MVARLFIDKHADPARLAIMSWMFTHSSLDGVPFEKSNALSADIGLPEAKTEIALEFLLAHRFLEFTKQGDGQRLRAIFVD
jgi:hypothetical protein